MKLLQHISVAEYAIHFLLKGLPACEELGHVVNMGIWDVASVPPEFTHVNSNGPLVSREEIVHRRNLMESGRRQRLPHEQKSISFMNDLS